MFEQVGLNYSCMLQCNLEFIIIRLLKIWINFFKPIENVKL